MSSSLHSPTSFLRGAFRRLPIETALVTLAVATMIHLMHSHLESVWHLRILFSSVFAVPLVFAFHERFARTSPRAFASAAGIALATFVAVCLALPTLGTIGRPPVQWGFLLVGLAAYLAPFVVAAPRFSLFVRRFFEEVTTWALLGTGAVAAIFVTGYAIDTLFDVSMKELTGDAVLVTTGAIVLLVLDRLLPDRAANGKVPELWRRLATAIGAPFVCVMLGILIVYQVTVVLRGELPSNTLSPLLIAAGFVGFLCTLIITAVAAEPVGQGALTPAEPHRFLRDRSIRLARAFPIVLLALLPMALWALCVRIEQYGLTPFRVVRMAALLGLTVLSVLGTLRWLRGRAPLGWQVPATIAAFALVVSAGPLSAVNLSIRSQTRRLAQLLDDAGVEDRHVAPTPRKPVHHLLEEQRAQLRDAIEILGELGGARALGRVLSGELEQCTDSWDLDRCLEGLGIGREHVNEAAAYAQSSHTLTLAAPVSIPAGQLSFLELNSYDRGIDQGTGLRLPCSADDPEGRVRYAHASLTAVLAAGDPGASLAPEPISLRGEGCDNPGVVVIQQLEISSSESGRSVRRLEGVWVR
jgi:Domain of unknown function (DUF4153)